MMLSPFHFYCLLVTLLSHSCEEKYFKNCVRSKRIDFRVVYVQNTFELADGFHTFAVHPQVEEADVFFNDGS